MTSTPNDLPPIRCAVHRCVTETPQLEGLVVIIDVFRASNTILAAFEAGAAEVLLLADLEGARELKRRQPASALLGERDGIMPQGFDGNNSPAAVGSLVAPGQTVILTTSAGTQAVTRLEKADHATFASFANAAAVAEWTRTLHSTTRSPVHLLAAGLCGREPAIEDDLCAQYLDELLAGRAPSFGAARQRLLSSSGANRLRRLGQHDDLEWCSRLDITRHVPTVLPGQPPRAVIERLA